MCKKKLLSAAIGTALAMGAGVSYAGTFELISPTSITKYASEEIGTSGTQIISNDFTVRYTLAPTSLDTNLYVVFTLNGATWQESLTSDDLTNNNGGVPSISIVKDGAVDQNTVQFLVEANSNDTLDQDNPLEFTFKVADIYGLSSPGSEISVTIELSSAASGNSADTTESEVVARSAAAVEITVAEDQENTRSAIDVAQGSTVFIDSLSPTSVSLGTIQLKSAGTGVTSVTGTPYTFDAKSGSLTVLNGIFSASLQNNGVFIDLNSSGVYDDLEDLPATTVDATTATWTFTPAQLESLYDAGVAKRILVVADGETTINDNPDAPSATILVEFETDRIVSGSLKHVERNGTICTVYNVPPSGAVDDGNIRITNNSATKTGVVLGTLWDKDGNALFTNQTLVAEIAPLNTVRITPVDIETVLTEVSGGNTTSWGGRAVLVVSSDLTDMEVFNLLRNANGGPLLNMSTGGTGNSCD